MVMPKYITRWAVERMRLELNRLEAQARRELKDPELKPLGLLRIDLVEECRRRLTFVATQANIRGEDG